MSASTSPPAPAASVALMYHALTGAGSPELGQDPHYSVSVERFEAHLALLKRRAACAPVFDQHRGDLRQHAGHHHRRRGNRRSDARLEMLGRDDKADAQTG